MHKNQKKFFKVLAGVFLLIVVVSGFLISISKDDTLFYYTVNEVFKNPEKHYQQKIRLMGLVEENSEKSLGDNKMTFNITENFTNSLNVQFTGLRPDMFREGQGVVAEGYLDKDNVFISTNLMVKHTEEYVTPKDADNMQTMIKSIQKNAVQ